jgi:hypothetical protein
MEEFGEYIRWEKKGLGLRSWSSLFLYPYHFLPHFTYISILKMEAAGSSEKSINMSQNTALHFYLCFDGDQ